MDIVLVHPEIPQNTGNISRTCAVTGTGLHLVHPIGFSIDARSVRRAGLDYWDSLHLTEHASIDAFMTACVSRHLVFLTSRSTTAYHEVVYREDSLLVFGCETSGLPPELLHAEAARCARIPTLAQARCLNLSNAVAIVLYEALRQLGFPGLELSRSQ